MNMQTGTNDLQQAQFSVHSTAFTLQTQYRGWHVGVDPVQGRGYYKRGQGEAFFLRFVGKCLRTFEGQALPMHVRETVAGLGYETLGAVSA